MCCPFISFTIRINKNYIGTILFIKIQNASELIDFFIIYINCMYTYTYLSLFFNCIISIYKKTSFYYKDLLINNNINTFVCGVANRRYYNNKNLHFIFIL